jgi:hypothetical protein
MSRYGKAYILDIALVVRMLSCSFRLEQELRINIVLNQYCLFCTICNGRHSVSIRLQSSGRATKPSPRRVSGRALQ